LHGLQSRKSVSIIKEHQIMVLIFSGRDFSPGVTGRAKLESISICNAKKTAAIFIISGMTKLRITNAYIHDCRIANSAGRRLGAGSGERNTGIIDPCG
jgi:hypothetical protein